MSCLWMSSKLSALEIIRCSWLVGWSTKMLFTAWFSFQFSITTLQSQLTLAPLWVCARKDWCGSPFPEESRGWLWPTSEHRSERWQIYRPPVKRQDPAGETDNSTPSLGSVGENSETSGWMIWQHPKNGAKTFGAPCAGRLQQSAFIISLS